jgi:7-carboxy-7-deazaguanine synthase
MHAVNPKNKDKWKAMDEVAILAKLKGLSVACREVTLSGGNPLIHDLTDLVVLLQKEGYYVNVETQGTIFRPWVSLLDYITISPKPPSAGGNVDGNLSRLNGFLLDLRDALNEAQQRRVPSDVFPPICVKVPVDSEGIKFYEDYNFARRVFEVSGAIEGLWIEPYISIVTYPDDESYDVIRKYREVVEVVSQDAKMGDVTILPQLHVLLWGHKLGV